MSAAARHAEWLSLVEQSGPFLALPVLEEVLPQGVDIVETGERGRLRSAYEEWREAVEQDDSDLDSLHREWVRLVLDELLGYGDEVLKPRSELDASLSYTSPEHGWTAEPDMAVLADGEARLLVAVYPPDTDLERPLRGSRGVASPAERMALLCRKTGVPLGLVTDGERWTLVNRATNDATGYASWYARIWLQEPLTLQAFRSLLGVRRCFGPADERLDSLLEKSLEFQEEVTDTLGQQVRRAVEVLVQALDRADEDRNRELLRDVYPRELYEAGLTVMMRLVFVLCAEERKLFLLGDSIYDEHYAVAPLRAQLQEEAGLHGQEVLERRHDAWSRLLSVFRAVYGGIEHESLRLPAMGGSLFDPDRFPFLEGRAKGTDWRYASAKPLPIDNRTVLMLLTALQVLKQTGGAMSLSYKALDVEQIGHVYEGLLEYTVARMERTTLGLIGSQKAKSPNIALSELESARMDGERPLLELVEQVTGRSRSALRKALVRAVDEADYDELLQVCGGDTEHADRVRPFVHLLRKDNWGDPLVYREGSLAVTLGTDRRETGTHYTPKSITEAVVETTLEPLAYIGPAEGYARGKWQLKSADELMELKICDPAMGSGAFLVQVCRWLSERLVDAWTDAENSGHLVTTDGEVVTELGEREPMPTDLEERLLVAKRLVTERCLYGVDKNPLAVELAKLSLWLTTLAKGRPFGFLDHNVRCGDSLLGIRQLEQLTQLRMDPSGKDQQIRLFGRRVERAVEEAIDLRLRLRSTPIRDIRDVEAMERLDSGARERVELAERAADRLIDAALNADGKERALEGALQGLSIELEGWLGSETGTHESDELPMAAEEKAGYRVRRTAPGRCFHWPLEFPEVFHRENGGFDAFVGNPPFLGNRLWKSTHGETLAKIARMVLGRAPGKIDLCVVFHRRVADLLREEGTYGLLATSNIAEGSAISVGLGELVERGEIFYSRKGMPWPGKAATVIAIICFSKGCQSWKGVREADGEMCDRIGARLTPELADIWKPQRLKNSLFAFEGVHNGRGQAFILGPENSWFEPLRTEQGSLLRSYVTGNDITSHALQRVDRSALDIGDLDLEEIESRWPRTYRFLTEVVQPTRTKEALKSYKGLHERWWQFWNHRADQMRRLRRHDECIAYSKVTKYPICMLAPSQWIYTNKVLLIGFEREDALAICLSTLFRSWIEFYCGGGVGVTMTLSIKESVAKYPLPDSVVSSSGIRAASNFNDTGVAWCTEHSAGLTDLMNSIHSPEHQGDVIVKLRELLRELDSAVAGTYGWIDLDMEYDFREHGGESETDRWRYDVSPEVRAEILNRLGKLNRKRYEEEVARGRHGKRSSGTSAGRKGELAE